MIESLNVITHIILIFSASMVILSSNPIHSVLFLILSYTAAAVTLLVLNAEFIALLLVLLYVGAVAVLFLFVVLMIDIKNHLKISYFFYSVILSFIFLIEIIFLILENFKLNTYSYNNFFLTDFQRNWIYTIDTSLDLQVLGQILSINFVIYLLITGLVLFLGIISSVYLTFNFNNTQQETKLQTVFRQLSKNFSKSLQF